MKKLNRLLIKGTNWALAGLLSLLGFSCSDDDEDGGIYPMYGVPLTYYTIKGKVIDKKESPVEDIKVEIYREENYMALDPLLTNKDGMFSASFYGNGNAKIIVTDIDGHSNGSFEKDSVIVTFTKEDYLAQREGYRDGGFAEKEIIITLKEISKE